LAEEGGRRQSCWPIGVDPSRQRSHPDGPRDADADSQQAGGAPLTPIRTRRNGSTSINLQSGCENMNTIKLILCIGIVAVVATAIASAAPQSLPEGSYRIAAAGSCKSWFSQCAARCKAGAPADRTCVTDHCVPKLAECRATGCWQEAGQYGGGRHCGLAK
jgi:hypothetical protein